jgi:hypothetical protein
MRADSIKYRSERSASPKNTPSMQEKWAIISLAIEEKWGPPTT